MEIELLRNADTFNAIFAYIKIMSSTATLYFSESRMYAQILDSAHVSICEVSLPAAWFDSYKVPAGRAPLSVGINVSVLSRVLSVREKDQCIRLTYTPGAEILEIHIVGGAATKRFAIHTVCIELDSVLIPDSEYQAEFTLQSSVLCNIVSQLKMFGDTVGIVCSESVVSLAAENELGAMKVDLIIDELTAFAIEEECCVTSSFSLNYIFAFLSLHAKISKYIEVKLSAESPIQLVYFVGVDATVRFYLAPKIMD
jgi:proliferating cell nuclear antigen